MESERTFEITTGTLLRWLLGALGIVVLIYLRDIVAEVLFALVLTAGLTPGLRALDRQGIPRAVGAVVVLLLLVVFVVAVVAAVVPPLVHQLQKLDTDLPHILERVRTIANAFSIPLPEAFGSSVNLSLQQLTVSLENVVRSLATGATAFGHALVTVAVVLVLTLYLSLSRDGIRGLYRPFVPEGALPFVARVEHTIERRLGRWVRGQLLVSLLAAIATYVALLLLHVPYAILLAVIGGVTMVIPVASALLSGIPTVLAAATVGTGTAIATSIFLLLLHQIIANAVVPRVIGDAVRFNPMVVLAVMLAGAALSGVVGLLLAVPLAAAVAAAAAEITRET